MSNFISVHELVLLTLGFAAYGVVTLPHVLRRQPLSYPIIFVAAGALLFSLPLDLPEANPIAYPKVVERLSEIGVITSLMGAGLAINRVPGWRSWGSAVKLLAITMPLTIAAIIVLGWWALGLTPAAAILLGAVLAPTDPVLASDVQVSGPDAHDDDEVRFALTSEAGLNDGLGFPFTSLAILIAVNGLAPSGWLGHFLFIDLGFKIVVGVVAGLVVGRVLGSVIFARYSPLPRIKDGMIALAATLIAYAGTEALGGYGFLAVFVAAVVIRNQERKHSYQEVMHAFSNQIERLLSAGILILFGGALVSGVLKPLDWQGVLVAIAIVLIIRPSAGMVALAGSRISLRQRLAISFFGIRGVGSFYYLAYASRQVEFPQLERLWAITVVVVAISIVVHGTTATLAMAHIDRAQRRAAGRLSDPSPSVR
ncbi:MAG: hypothetical protein RJA70_1618 [Pseudomonadota bacterium]|jgi:NhaP-type Na+/H+ or K+/H+ antiporter